MATLYLIEQNTVLRKSSERLLLCRKPSQSKSPGVRIRDVLLELPCEDIDQVMLFGNVQVTTQALQQLLRHGIELALFTFSGKLLGQLTPPKTKNIPLRLAQFEKYKDFAYIFRTAKVIVANKLTNALQVLKRYQANHPNAFARSDLDKLGTIIRKVTGTDSLDSLRGLEGSGSAIYFRQFGKMFKKPWHFSTRNRRPPKDPVNAVLSFGYTIVNTELQSLLDGYGFDPYLGFYHTLHYGRPGLALDLLEAFRHSLVDRLTLNLFNLRVLNENDFYYTSEESVLLSSSGKQKFFQQYERMAGKYVGDAAVPGQSKSFRYVFQKQVENLARAVSDNSVYEPYCLK